MTIPKNRRKTLAIIATAIAAPLTGHSVLAQISPPSAPGAASKPYNLVSPSVKSDAKTIRFLFSYDCSYCRSYHNGMKQWGASLPKQYKFETTPVITSTDNANQTLAVYGRIVIQEMDASKITTYDYAMYEMLQGDPDTGLAPKGEIKLQDILRTLVKIGLDVKSIQSFLESKGAGLEKKLPSYGKLVNTYGLKVTPSISLVGKYIVTPDDANNNPQQFLLLLNGLVSRIIQGGENAL